jgi:S-adenosyl-L-methionine hydrolase (adenosine-forming)
MAIITLTTDFGIRDGYVGAVKGVIASLAPDARVVDLAHDIPRGDIAHAAWVVRTSTCEFPPDSIHLVAVDPGVGGERQNVVVASHGRRYVGPDNGVFAYLDAVEFAWRIDNTALLASEISPTFHGRDVFARVAAALALGKHADTVGRQTILRGQLPWGPRPAGEGRVVHFDSYGNLITDLPPEEAGAAVAIAGRRLALSRTPTSIVCAEPT